MKFLLQRPLINANESVMSLLKMLLDRSALARKKHKQSTRALKHTHKELILNYMELSFVDESFFLIFTFIRTVDQ